MKHVMSFVVGFIVLSAMLAIIAMFPQIVFAALVIGLMYAIGRIILDF